jgi:hypothetical protein
MRTTRVVLSQLIFLYQLCRVTGWCWMCRGFWGTALSSGIGVRAAMVGEALGGMERGKYVSTKRKKN